MFRWGQDKFNTGYRLFTIFFSRRFDCYIFHYKDGSFIPKHRDPLMGYKAHWRLNFVLKKPNSGGLFLCENQYTWWRFTLFRADRDVHSVTPCVGDRWLLSFGIRL